MAFFGRVRERRFQEAPMPEELERMRCRYCGNEDRAAYRLLSGPAEKPLGEGGTDGWDVKLYWDNTAKETFDSVNGEGLMNVTEAEDGGSGLTGRVSLITLAPILPLMPPPIR